ncbi:MAG: hypothetical protein JWM57_3533 [Phycisphaerales bacterium]|nr:hypothetical protein [Phycisphaerales bacterium]
MKVLSLFGLALLSGCAMAPSERLSFPSSTSVTENDRRLNYDMDGDRKPDFATLAGPDGRIDRLEYDDNEDGTPDRIYRLSDYADDDVPHVIILLDSIPYSLLAERYAGGDFRFFDPPQKMIAPFPSLTEVCYSDILQAPPLQTVIDTQYDPRIREHRSDIWKRAVDHYQQPWERRCDYAASYAEGGLSFLDPKSWCAAEMSRAKRAIDASPRRTTIVYIASAASYVCKEGRAGANAVLDDAKQLCLQLLYERHGAIKISMMADHGHNLMPSKNVILDDWLKADGFHVTDVATTPDDVVISINGLVTNALLQTGKPEAVAKSLCQHEPIELAMYMSGDRVIVRSAAGSAAIDMKDGRFRYVPIDADVLNYAEVVKTLPAGDGGFADEKTWYAVTADHNWPAAPPRLWAAFHRQFVTPPSVMLSFKDGYYCGKPEYENFITMKSTHGGLNQVNSATFVMTMTGRMRGRSAKGMVLPRDVMSVLCPGAPLQVVR